MRLSETSPIILNHLIELHIETKQLQTLKPIFRMDGVIAHLGTLRHVEYIL